VLDRTGQVRICWRHGRGDPSASALASLSSETVWTHEGEYTADGKLFSCITAERRRHFIYMLVAFPRSRVTTGRREQTSNLRLVPRASCIA
jgi:hypothetical protein